MSCQKYQRELASNFSAHSQRNNSMSPEIYHYQINPLDTSYYFYDNCKKKCCKKKEQSNQLVEIKIGGLKFSLTPLTFFVLVSLILVIVIIILITR